MAQIDALRLAESLQRRLADFVVGDNYSRDPNLTRICRQLWSENPQIGGLLSDLWVEGNFPAKTSDWSLEKLVSEGQFDSQLCQILDESGAVPKHRPLYTHQYESLTEANRNSAGTSQKAIGITAGTGDGKTEAFLLPILNDLYTMSESESPGVKCLLLYPMNALVNDQVDRLYKWLKGQSKVRIFHFTSETPEDKRAADKAGIPVWDDCRIRHRQEARDNIPDILITNYSMLEYMLCRPQDSVFFGPALRAVVLDEAHLYTGTLAAEIALLLRRLYIRCNIDSDNLLQLATSATLGTGDVEELRGFIATIFSKTLGLVRIIEGKSDRVSLSAPSLPSQETSPESLLDQQWIDQPLVQIDEVGEPILLEDKDRCNRLSEELYELVSPDTIISIDPEENRPAVVLWNTLLASPLIHKLESILWVKKRIALDDLAESIWDRSDTAAKQATIILLQLAASARENAGDYPLVPHRIHLMVKPNDGLSVCLNKNCDGQDSLKLDALGAVTTGIYDDCPACGDRVLSVYRCDNCGEWILAGHTQGHFLRPVAPNQLGIAEFFTLKRTSHANVFSVNPSTGERSGAEAQAIKLTAIDNCPQCEREQEGFMPFSTRSNLFLSILTESLLSECPPYPSDNNAWLPARGRRVLAFSDSRREAARLGPRLTRQHDIQLTRSAIVKCIESTAVGDDGTLGLVESQIGSYEQQISNQILSSSERQFIEQEIQRYREIYTSLSSGGSIEDWSSALKQQILLSEILDQSMSKNQYAVRQTANENRAWSQRDWERNRDQTRRKAELFLAREFARLYRRDTSLEVLGLVEVTYPGLDKIPVSNRLLGQLPSEHARVRLREIWGNLLGALCDTLRSDGVVNVVSDEDLSELGITYIDRWCAKGGVSGSYLTNFTGQSTRHRRLWFATAVLNKCSVDEDSSQELASTLLDTAFDQLLERASSEDGPESGEKLPWLQRSLRQTKGMPKDAIQIVFNRLGLRRPNQVYRCSRTGHMWTRSVAGCAPEMGCLGTLLPISEEELESDSRVGRYRREYRESAVFQMGLWAEEHSAQLSPGENRRLQDLFKAGIRNILSATTTLELGIDIGGLNAVLMSNVPPGKANYLQRAGRAGRRADGSSIVVTYARPQPYDREVFYNIGNYLDRPLRRPLVLLNRDRIVRRHLNSYLLGSFFKELYPSDLQVGAMRAFGDMGHFCEEVMPSYWQWGDVKPILDPPTSVGDGLTLQFSWLSSSTNIKSLADMFCAFLQSIRDDNGDEVRSNVKNLLSKSNIVDEIDDWSGLLQNVEDDFNTAVINWQEEYSNLLRSWQRSEDRIQANAIRYQLRTLHGLTVIESFADRQFLPHYSFPIGVHKLRVIVPDEDNSNKIRQEDQYRLDRNSLLALREYVPGSQLLAGGKLITSKGLLKHWTGEDIDGDLGLRGRCCTCENGHFYYWISDTTTECPICNSEPSHSPRGLLFPKHGFSSAAWDPPKWSNDVEHVGKTETASITFTQHGDVKDLTVTENFGEISGLTARYRGNGDLLVYNRGENEKGFAICLKCGYADSEKEYGEGRVVLPTGFDSHAPLTATSPWFHCWSSSETPILRNQILAARETTDVLMLDFSAWVGGDEGAAVATTLGHALLRAGAQLLDLDHRELGVLIVPAGEGGKSWGAVIYDSTAGGAGHVRELFEIGRRWLQETHQTLWINRDHHERCETACLECLLSFTAQYAVADNLFNRKLAFSIIDDQLNGLNSTPSSAQSSDPINENTENVESMGIAEGNNDSLRMARERMSRRRKS